MAGISNPFPRIARPTVGSDYFGHRAYVFHPAYATAPERYVQAYVLLQTDLLHVFEYVEPADKNNGCYSFRIQEILLRACIEVEANWKAILTANHYPAGKWDRRDYRLIEESHRLSGWTVQIPHWSGGGNIRRPFAACASAATSSKLSW